MVVPGIVYVPDIDEHDTTDDNDIIDVYKNGLYNAWKIVGTMAPRLLRKLFWETVLVEHRVFHWLVSESPSFLRDDVVFDEKNYQYNTARESYTHIIKSCPVVTTKVNEYKNALKDVYSRDIDLFNDIEQGWRAIVALTPDHEYLGHVYIRRGSRFGTEPYLPWNQLDYLEMFGIRESLCNLTNTLCPSSNHKRLSVSRVLMHGIHESMHVNKLIGVDVVKPLPRMEKILKDVYKFRPVGGGRLVFHMRSTAAELFDTLNELGATEVECINTPMVFVPCESFVMAAVVDYAASRIGKNFTKSEWKVFLRTSHLMEIIFNVFQKDPCLSIITLRKTDIPSLAYELLPIIVPLEIDTVIAKQKYNPPIYNPLY